MGIAATLYTVRQGSARTRSALERRLRAFDSASHVTKEESDDLFDSSLALPTWRYLASALHRNGRTGPLPRLHALGASDSPLAWALRPRQHVVGPYYVNTPADVARIDQRIRDVNGAEFEALFRTAYDAVVAEYQSGGLSLEAARRSAGPGHFAYEAVAWGRLAGLYARAAAMDRFVVADIS